MSNETEWYWDLERKIVVPASQRGSFDHVLGPYATKQEAENWKSIAEERNEDWDEDDQAWEHAGESDET